MFTSIENQPYRVKPKGGLWASPIGAKHGWKDWCESESFRDCEESDSFRFTLNEGANILQINSVNDLINLPQVEDKNLASWVCLDFEQLSQNGIGAVQVNISKSYEIDEDFDNNLYWKLYGWDCDSILVMNPNVIIADSE